jgi:toxin YoeB
MAERVVIFDRGAWDDYLWWQAEDRKTLKKINQLIREALRTPESGTGQVENLGSGRWSRRINAKDRLVYEFTDGALLIAQCRGHYADR